MSENVYGENVKPSTNQEEESDRILTRDDLDFTDYQNLVREEVLNWELDSETGVVMLSEDIDSSEITRLMKEIIYIRKLNPDLERITMIINSPGGDAQTMLAIIDYMKSLDIPIDVICRGIAMSAAAVIFTCATGKRYISKHSTMMFHEISIFNMGKNRDVKASQKHTDFLEDAMYNLVAEHSNKDVEFWKNAMSKDYYVTAQEAVDLGVADAII